MTAQQAPLGLAREGLQDGERAIDGCRAGLSHDEMVLASKEVLHCLILHLSLGGGSADQLHEATGQRVKDTPFNGL